LYDYCKYGGVMATIDSISFRLSKDDIGVNDAAIIVSLYPAAEYNLRPDYGTSIASKTIAVSALPTTEGLVTFTFDAPVTVIDSEFYGVRIQGTGNHAQLAKTYMYTMGASGWLDATDTWEGYPVGAERGWMVLGTVASWASGYRFGYIINGTDLIHENSASGDSDGYYLFYEDNKHRLFGMRSYIEVPLPLPSKPINPTPAHESTEVDFSGLTLSWESGGGTETSYDVYFGSTVLFDEFVFLGNTVELSTVVPYTITGDEVDVDVEAYVGDPNVFNKIHWNVPLYWRVDARDDEDNVAEGDVWWFDARPPKATTPAPVEEYGQMTLDWGSFSWDPVTIATSYDTYLGLPAQPFTNVINSGVTPSITQSDFIAGVKTGFNPAGLADYGADYNWRVDSKNLFGVTEGDTWTFSTIALLPPLDLHSEYDITWYALSTKRSLLVCARNKVWYEQ
jgi:hypothetical protein